MPAPPSTAASTLGAALRSISLLRPIVSICSICSIAIAAPSSGLLAQVEVAVGGGGHWYQQRSTDGSVLEGDGAGVRPSFFLGYRTTARWSYGVECVPASRRLPAAVAGVAGGLESREVPVTSVGFTPTAEYRLAPWLLLRGGVGYNLAYRAGSVRLGPPTLPQEITAGTRARDSWHGRVGVEVVDRRGFVRLSASHSLPHLAPEAFYVGEHATPDTDVSLRGVDLAIGVRFGPSERRYPGATDLDSALRSALAPIATRAPGWGLGIESGYFFTRAKQDGVALFDGLNGSRVRAVLSHPAGDDWTLRGGIGWRSVRAQGEAWLGREWAAIGVTKVQQAEFSLGAEYALLPTCRLGADFGTGIALGRSHEVVPQRSPVRAEVRLDEAAPLRNFTVQASPYLRFALGTRLHLDARAEVFLNSPYGDEPDLRLLDPQLRRGQRQGSWLAGGFGLGYALL